jgi:hypothetical protein
MMRTHVHLTLDLAAAVVGIIGAALPQITFWWRLPLLIVVAACIVDLCLSTPFRLRLTSSVRVVMSLVALSAFVGRMWTPMREQYLDEHLLPSFVFVTPGFWSPASEPRWYFVINHFGPKPAYNSELSFLDLDRAAQIASQGSVSPQQLAQEEITLLYPEVDPSTGGNAKLFLWAPLIPDHEHYSVRIVSREGTFDETLQIERVAGQWLYRIRVLDLSTPQTMIDCRDPGFPEKAAVALPKCFPQYVTEHQGDARLEPWPPARSRGVYLLLVLAFVVFYVPCALWWMGALRRQLT